MKNLLITSVLLAMFATCTTIQAQNQPEEYLGLPGDNLNLYAVMKLFQDSPTLESFEQRLNDENSTINNLDLNGDNRVDYIRVVDYVDGDVHNIVLQDPINRNETQDVAVFTVQRFSNGQVQIQLTGDEALYGRNYIIEPIFDNSTAGQTPNPGYTGRNIAITRTTTFEIANWPLVMFIYRPNYVVWHSSWYWGYYPSYWHPWRPFYWHFYYGYQRNFYNDYYAHYRRWDNHRYNRWNDFYYSSRRSHAPDVIVRINSGKYKSTYSHPDQRRQGEARYARMEKSQNNWSSDRSSVNSSTRRSATQSTQDRRSTGTSTGISRRSNNTITSGSATNPSSRQNNGTTRRSSTTVTTRSASNPSSGNSNSVSRRSTNTVTTRSVSNPSSGQNAATSSGSAGRVSSKSATNRSSRQSAGTTRSSGRSTATKASSSSRKSSRGEKSSASSSRSEKTKESANTKAGRRK